MAKYKLTNKAVEDLTKIWDYTFETWSERQADKYYDLLIWSCQEIANNPNSGKKYDGITPSLFGIKASRHIIFYRNIDEGYVEITRILHERLGLKKQILD